MASHSNDHEYISDDERFADYEVDDWDEAAYQREYEQTHLHISPDATMDNKAPIIPSTEAPSPLQTNNMHYCKPTGPNDNNNSRGSGVSPKVVDPGPWESHERPLHQPVCRHVQIPSEQKAHVGGSFDYIQPRDVHQSPFLTDPYPPYEGSYETTYLPVGPPIFFNSPPVDNVVDRAVIAPVQPPVAIAPVPQVSLANHIHLQRT